MPIFLTWLWAVVLIAIGIWQIFWPQVGFNDISVFFRDAPPAATWQQKQRLSRVLEARSVGEAKSPSLGPFTGIVALLLAAAVGLLHLEPSVAYAVLLLCMALQLSIAYGEFRSSSERRAAPLTRRAWYSVISPAILVYCVISVYAGVACLFVPQLRLTATLLLFAVGIMFVVAARVAVVPARLLGDDPEVENLVDERIRYFRANWIALVAPFAINLFVGWQRGRFPNTVQYLSLPVILSVAYLAAIYFAIRLPQRKPLVLPDGA